MSGISTAALIRGEGIARYGLTFYPITMEFYEEWNALKGVLTLRMSTLPALYATMPYLGALYAMDVDAVTGGRALPGFMARLAHILCRALRMPADKPETFVGFRCKADDPRILTELTVSDGQTMAHIPAQKFCEIRELLAAQNGEELPDDAENPELVRAQMDMAASGAQLRYDFSTLIASVAYKSGVMESDVLAWTIRAFNQRQKAITRDKCHTINGIAEGNGATWKNGNPVPHWCFDREESATGGFRSEQDMLGEMGKVGNIRK